MVTLTIAETREKLGDAESDLPPSFSSIYIIFTFEATYEPLTFLFTCFSKLWLLEISEFGHSSYAVWSR